MNTLIIAAGFAALAAQIPGSDMLKTATNIAKAIPMDEVAQDIGALRFCGKFVEEGTEDAMKKLDEAVGKRFEAFEAGAEKTAAEQLRDKVAESGEYLGDKLTPDGCKDTRTKLAKKYLAKLTN